MGSAILHSLRLVIPTLVGITYFSGSVTPCLASELLTDEAPPLTGEATADGFYLHAGPGALVFDASAKVKAAGTLIPNGSVKIDPNITLITELGYRWQNWGVSFTGGFPPKAVVSGSGALAPLGKLGSIRYGPTVLTAHYHFTQFGRVQPYLGAGPVFLLIFKNRDGAIKELDVHDHLGAAIQAGFEYRLAPRWSLFFDAKKAALKTNATALLGPAPVNAHITLNPTVITSGLSYCF